MESQSLSSVLETRGAVKTIGIKRFDFVGHLGLQGLFSKFLFQTN